MSVAVQVDLPDSCPYVGSWGQPMLLRNIAYVDTQFWVVTNIMCSMAIFPVSRDYDLGPLPPGNYTFYFRAWGMTVKAEAFLVPEPSSPRLSILRLSNPQAGLSWPTNATNYARAWALVLPAQTWSAVTNRLPVIGDEFALPIDLAGAPKLYKLRRP